MKVYIVVQEPFHENSTVLSAHASLEGAESSIPDAPGDYGFNRSAGSPRGRWARSGFYVDNAAFCVSQRVGLDLNDLTDPNYKDQDGHLIYELELQAEP